MLALFLFCSAFELRAQKEEAQKHLKILTSEEFAGRGYVNGGMQKSAAYIQETLTKYGAQPAGVRESFYQPITPFAVNTFPNRITFAFKSAFHYKTADNSFSNVTEYLLHPASGSIELNEVAVVKVTKWNDSTQDNIRSGAVYFFEKDDLNSAALIDIEQFLLQNTLIKNTLFIVNDSTLPAWYPVNTRSNNALVYTRNLALPSVINANWETILNQQFEAANVIGKISGTSSDSAIMFSAHYDHLGQMGSHIFPGANDNASGVAMLLTLAAYYAQHKPKFDTYLLFTCAEEIGLLGSYFYVNNPVFPLSQIKFLINLDLVGTGEEGITVVNSIKQKHIYDQLINLNNNRLPQIKQRGEACNSDHCFFDKAGVPAIFIYTLGGSKAYHNTADDYASPSLEAFNDLQSLLIETVKQL